MILLPRQVVAPRPEDLQADWAPPEQSDSWVPGDPIYEAPNSGGYQLHPLYDFRDDWEREPLPCYCSDRADWPDQTLKPLGDRDELGEFIAEERAHRIQQRLGFTG